MADLKVNRIIAAGVFCIAFGVYIATLSPTVVFWDVGEFIAAAKLLQVPHPPGSPLFLLAARIAMMIPYAADQAVRAHAFSALLSALAIVFSYLVFVRLMNNWRGIPGSFADRVMVHGAAAIGALTLAFSPTYWGRTGNSRRPSPRALGPASDLSRSARSRVVAGCVLSSSVSTSPTATFPNTSLGG